MTQYMLMFSLGPVQPFIEQARKTRDLWLGSYLLSNLIEAAMKEVEQARLGAEFVFPTERNIDSKYSNLPNKYIAIFNSIDEAQSAVEFSKNGIRDCWNTIREDIWTKIVRSAFTNDIPLGTTLEIWNQQSSPEVFFEIFWVIVEGDRAQYSSWLQRTEAALDARKRLRNFQPQEEPGEKSTISGERQALHGALDDSDSIRNQVKKFWKELTTKAGSTKRSLSPRDISLDGSERLDAIDTIKRFATESSLLKELKQAFPSTSSIATASFVERLLTIDAPKLQNWRNATRGPLADMPTDTIPFLEKRAGENKWILNRDGDCYFIETFTARRLEKDYALSEAEAKGVAIAGQQGLKALLAVADEFSIRRPTPYYAVMKMDGDRMGKLLSSVYSQNEHIRISEALSYFARKIVPPLLEEKYPGRLVYTGGDDVLAFAPLARDIPEKERNMVGTIYTLLDLVDQLQQQYREQVQKEVSDDRKQAVTASTGIAIAHHFTPLSAVLYAVREAEKEIAKGRYGRDALVVTLIRRSGEQTRVGCHWRYKELGKDDDLRQPINLFSHFYNLFDQDVLSPKCIYNLLDEAATLIDLQPEAQASEIKRVLLRQRDNKKKDLLPDITAEETAKNLVELAVAMDKAIDVKHEHDKNFTKSVYLHEDRLRYGLVETLGWLQVMVFLARKELE